MQIWPIFKHVMRHIAVAPAIGLVQAGKFMLFLPKAGFVTSHSREVIIQKKPFRRQN